MSDPQISVVLPTYNHIQFLPGAVNSILAQRFTAFELIIVDDGSTDDTSLYLESIADHRVRIIKHSRNQRLPAALNTGMRAARGKFVTWISADNLVCPDFLMRLYTALDMHPECKFAYSQYNVVDDKNNIYDIRSISNYCYRNLFLYFSGCASFMYLKDIHHNIGYYDECLNGAEDYDMLIRIFECVNFTYIPYVLLSYRVHSESMSENIPDKIIMSGRHAIENAMSRNNGTLDIIKLYPEISQCKNKNKAEYDACLDFGARILTTRCAKLLINPKFAFKYFYSALLSGINDPLCVHNIMAMLACTKNMEKNFYLILDDMQEYCHQNKEYLMSIYNNYKGKFFVPILFPDVDDSEVLSKAMVQA